MIGVEVDRVAVSYNGTRALDGVSLIVAPASWITLIGPNGSGKTTLLRAIGGLVDNAGIVRLGDSVLSDISRRDVARLVAYVPQRPFIPTALTVTDYVLMGRTPHLSYFATEKSSDVDAVEEVLERLAITGFARRSLGSLSGGELQRVVLARAFAQDAPVLLLDEPTNALDVGHQQHALELVDDLRRERSLTVISAMHDLTLAGQFAEGLVLLDRGRVVASGSARSILTEANISAHYGARVRIIHEPDGATLVIPVRSGGEGRT